MELDPSGTDPVLKLIDLEVDLATMKARVNEDSGWLKAEG